MTVASRSRPTGAGTARAIAANLVAANRLWTQSDTLLAQRYGLESETRAGVHCASARSFPEGRRSFGHVAIGFGILAPARRRALDAVLAYYVERRLEPRIQLLGDLVPVAAERLLRGAGLRAEPVEHHLFVRTSARVPPRLRGDPVTVSRVRPADAAPLAMLASAGFEGRGPAAEYFTRTRIAMLRDHPREAIAVRAAVGEEPAGSGIVVLAHGAGSLWSGSVLRPHRGQAVQRRLIAERVRIGLGRRTRVFCSFAHPESASATNLVREGFRDAGPALVFTR